MKGGDVMFIKILKLCNLIILGLTGYQLTVLAQKYQRGKRIYLPPAIGWTCVASSIALAISLFWEKD